MTAKSRREEIAALVEAHYAALYRYAFRLSGNGADAEDLTQQVFLIAQQKLNQLRLAENAQAWLFAITRNTYLKSRRGRRAETVLPLQSVHEPCLPDDEPPELSGEELTELLDALPEEFRLPLVLFYFEDLSYREIAAALNLPIGTVMSRLSRGKTHLRQRLLAGQAVPAD